MPRATANGTERQCARNDHCIAALEPNQLKWFEIGIDHLRERM
jgi:hypothetical protein